MLEDPIPRFNLTLRLIWLSSVYSEPESMMIVVQSGTGGDEDGDSSE